MSEQLNEFDKNLNTSLRSFKKDILELCSALYSAEIIMLYLFLR